MTLEDLTTDVEETYGELGESIDVELDRETRTELAMLLAATGADADELVRRGIHALFRTTVDTGDLDFQLRNGYDVSYDEYLMGMSVDEMAGESQYPQRDDERRYRM
ncbi:hypothetical protein [Halopenitus persicus]|jgi:hypothetical protein|uniref:Uncharacterized protein n=1 Tax=Halopenitus persicus TaxID=1048396 RepID=A0A1H3DN57_9EURY|nr:hypothetical protein [Halopenitus persicus]QHS16311.1 hypothetical protein GWK26_03595 [haloarchaeon 3A1-DGR]SDX67787.1 hypothetical protein SAMN05216564_10173 [Halopenitus persicus]